MQAIMEPIFDVAYLVSVITIGIKMIRRSGGKSRQYTLFGWMAVILGAGDSFHLVPRIIALCMMPQNRWTVTNPPLSWGIYRNIPFALLGLLIIVLYFRSAKAQNDRAFRWMWFTIVLSFGCYLPVVLFAETIPVMGALMIPKTCAYLWAVVIGFRAMKSEMQN